MQLQRILENKELRDQIFDSLPSDTELSNILGRDQTAASVRSRLERIGGGLESLETYDPGLEAIVRSTGRPVFFIQDLKIRDDDALEFWRKRLDESRARLELVVPAVGRVEVRNHPTHPWLGTAWLVTPEVVVTNRHVAIEFGRNTGKGFEFRFNPNDRRMRASVDFREEHERPSEVEHKVREILHIEDDGHADPDIAFLRVDPEGEAGEDLAQPVQLADGAPTAGQVIGVIGYAAWDGFRNPGPDMAKIFNGIYNVKRLHPGEVMEVRDRFLTHDCSTLGGNSGSVLVDFATGEAVGLHFAGSFHDENYALKARTVRERMEDLGIG